MEAEAEETVVELCVWQSGRRGGGGRLDTGDSTRALYILLCMYAR